MDRNPQWEEKVKNMYSQRAEEVINSTYTAQCAASSKEKMNNSEKAIKDLVLQWPQAEDMADTGTWVLNSSETSEN